AGDGLRPGRGDGRALGPPLGPGRDAAPLVARDVPADGDGGVLIELLPTRATFAPGEPIEVEVRGAERPVEVSLWRLDRLADTVETVEDVARFAPQPEGGYGVECGDATSALDV